MSRISKTMALSPTGPVRGGAHRNVNSSNSSNVTLLSIVRFYLKIFVYILIAFFMILQYINWKHASTVLLHNANRKVAMGIPSQSQSQQQQQKPPDEITTKIHIVFSTGCNAFQDCTWLYLVFWTSSM